jgi:outer membrane protein OmpA-like peptidoglycan-associated protein
MMGGVLSGAMVAQLYPQWSEGILGQSLSGGSASPVLEQFFQGVEHQRPRLAVQVYDWFNGPSALEPSRLAQWQPGELEAEIDRLLAASQTLETEVANLEQQLGLQAQAQGAALSGRLLALRQAVESPSGSILPLQMTLPADLLFEDGKTNLKADAQDLLNNLEKSLRSELNLPQGTRLNLTIATHTDSVGNAAHNLDLSLQRSRSLQNYLSQRLNSPALTWIPVGYGSTRPLADNSTESNRQRNRRVEMTLDW